MRELRVSIRFEPGDLWLGVYVDAYGRAAYVCIVPCVPIVIRWGARRVRCPLRRGERTDVVHDSGCVHMARITWDGVPITLHRGRRS